MTKKYIYLYVRVNCLSMLKRYNKFHEMTILIITRIQHLTVVKLLENITY